MKTLSNVCLLLGVALCLVCTEWTDVRFLAGADARAEEYCYAEDGYFCTGVAVACPTQRCMVIVVDETNPQSPVYIECRDYGEQGKKEKVQYLSYENHHKEVVKGASGHSGLHAGEDKPCKKTGTCGCSTEAPPDDQDRTPFCSSPKDSDMNAGPNVIKIRAVNTGSTACVGE
jgi:hypothetical protein